MNLRQATQAIQDENIIAWILNNGILNERGQPITFDKYAFLIDPYLDWNPNQGVRKCSQIGWSVMTNIKLFYAAIHGIPGTLVNSANVIYTLPSDSDVNQFVPSKTNKLIENNPVIKDAMISAEGSKKADIDSVQRKAVGNSFVYFKGTKSKTAALMLTSDLNIHDESDRSEKTIIDEYESRLGNSPFKGRWIFSNPSAPNMPADLLYKDSDQKHWFIKHDNCGHWQYLEWSKLSEENFLRKSLHSFVDPDKGLYICSKCGKPISDDNRMRGRWVKKYKNNPASGYWVSHMMCSWMSAADLLSVEAKKSKAYFYNFVRGIPYVGSDVRIDESVIVSNIVLGDPGLVKGRVCMGIDNGDTKHIVIGNEKGIAKLVKTRDWDVVKQLIEMYDPYFVVDLNPYPKESRDLARNYRKGYASFYVDDAKTANLVRWGDKDKMYMVYPNRDPMFDELVDFIFAGNLNFFGSKADWLEYIEHWSSMYRAKMVGNNIITDDSDIANQIGLKRVRNTWISSTGNDHFCHATLYFFVALMRMTGSGGKIVTDSTFKKLAAIRGEVGGVQTSGTVQDGMMKPTRNYLDVKDLIKGKSKGLSGGARSDNVR